MSGSMRELRHRIRSVGSTRQMTGAMRMVAASKYSRVQAREKSFIPYRDACARLLRTLGGAGDGARPAVRRVLYVFISANRGLCGDYNQALVRYCAEALSAETRPYDVLPMGRWAEENAALLGALLPPEELPDLPDWQRALALTRKLRALWQDEEYDEVLLVYQKCTNVLTQTPVTERFLPFAEESADGGAGEHIFEPDRESILPGLREQCLTARLYGCLLSAAEGAHAAMLVAMRQAADNSSDMLTELERRLNRMRQAAVTTEVLELQSGSRSADQEGGRYE